MNDDINLDEIFDDACPRGIIDIGSHIGSCFEMYKKHDINNRCWIEANPNVFDELVRNVPNEDIKMNYAICDFDGKVPFVITSNLQSSSILPLKKHIEIYPTIFPEKHIIVQGRKLDTLIHKGLIDIDRYDFLAMDIQGGEFKALEGFKKYIHKINYILAEVNYIEMYSGCMLIDDFDNYLKKLGFKKIMASKSVCGWGDAYYKRIKK